MNVATWIMLVGFLLVLAAMERINNTLGEIANHLQEVRDKVTYEDADSLDDGSDIP